MAHAEILVVEDERIVAKDIALRLTSRGYGVPGVVSSGAEAIRLVAQTHPDLVLMDIVLQGEMDGVEAADQIRSRFDIPVVYLTAYADADTLQRAKITRPFGYILKPFEERELYTAIEMALYQHQLEQKLRMSEQWLATTLRCIGDAVISTDAHGCITFMNPAAEALTGWDQEEALTQELATVFQILDDTTRTPAEHLVMKVLREGVAVGQASQAILRAKDGTHRPIDNNAAPIRDEQGHILGVVSVFRDISERKRAEEMLRKTQQELEKRVRERTAALAEANAGLRKEIAERKRAEEALRESERRYAEAYRREREAAERLRALDDVKDAFLARVSHELRTPLNAILGFAELMYDGRVGPVAPENREYLGDILTSAKHLLQLINDLLDLAKVRAGKLEFRPEPVDLRGLIGEVRDILRGLAASKGVRVEVEVTPNLGEIVLDPSRLKQVLYNYLSNALKFTPEWGRVTVRVTSEGPDNFRLEVEDTGVGIGPEDVGRLFVEFQQLDATMPKRYAGTGLGLPLTKRIVETQGGRVGVRSTPGQGSVFFAILPRVAGAVHEAQTNSHM